MTKVNLDQYRGAQRMGRRAFLGTLGLGGLSAAALAACDFRQVSPEEARALDSRRTATAQALKTPVGTPVGTPRAEGAATVTAGTTPAVEAAKPAVDPAMAEAFRSVVRTEVAGAMPKTSTPSASTTPERIGTVVPGNVRLEKPNFVEDISHGVWTIKGTSRLKENPIVAEWLKRLKKPAPEKGKYYPNIQGDYTLSEFDVKAGMEYGVPNVPFSEHPKGAQFIVPAWHYRLYTGPYKFMGEDHLSGDKQNGQMLLVINVGKESVTFADPDQEFRNGFTVAGRFWDGNKLDQGTSALTNHVTANMLNFPTNSRMAEVLNSGNPGNAGANCGIPEGCKGVDVNVIVVAGDAVIAQAKSVVTR